MFDLDRAIAGWRRQMSAAGLESFESLDELESHLRDDVEMRMRSGLTAEQAFTAAVREIGSAKSLKGEFEKNLAQDPFKHEWRARLAKIFVFGLAGCALMTGVSWLFKLPFGVELPLSGFAFAALLVGFVWLLLTARRAAANQGSLPVDDSMLAAEAKQSLETARREAMRFHHDFIGTEHALLGLFEAQDGIVAKVLRDCGLERGMVREEIEKIIGVGLDRETDQVLPCACTPRLKRAMQLAAREAAAMKPNSVGAEHLLLGLLIEGQGVAGLVLRRLGVSLEAARAAILRETGGAGGEPTTAS
jgi:hypothetical protein